MKKLFFAVMALGCVCHFAHAGKIFNGTVEIDDKVIGEAKPAIQEFLNFKEVVFAGKVAFEKVNPSVRELEKHEYQKQFEGSKFYGNYKADVSTWCGLHSKVRTIVAQGQEDFFQLLQFQLMIDGYVKNGFTPIDIDEMIFREILNCKI